MNVHEVRDLLEKEEENRIAILKSLDVETLRAFLSNYKEFFKENDIHPSEITMSLDSEQQKIFVSGMENINLTLSEKREILATLRDDVKQSMDMTNLPKEYVTAINIPTKHVRQVVFEFGRDFEEYRGLDNLIYVSPEEFTQEQRRDFMKFCDICPNAEVTSSLHDIVYMSNASEYKEAEKWISSVIDNLSPKYSQAQKIAIIDNAVGKKISYSPDYDTESFNKANSRALIFTWHI